MRVRVSLSVLILFLILTTPYLSTSRSSKAMPKSVKKAFVKIFDEKLSQPSESLEEAVVAKRGEKLWEEMEVQKRIVEETWG